MYYWVYTGDSPATARPSAGGTAEEAQYTGYRYVDVITGELTPIDGTPEEWPTLDNSIRPTGVTFALPYMGTTNDYNKVYCRVAVDAMGGLGDGEQSVILYIKYSTLTEIDVQATLSVDTTDVVIKADTTETATATLLGGDGYAITWTSSDESVATVVNGTISGEAAGNATITVTASKGEDTLTKTIAVTVVANTAVDTTVTAPTVTEGTASTTITGDVFLTSGGDENVTSTADEITLTATSSTSETVTSAAVTISSETVTALADTGKDVTIVTDTGTVTLNAAAMSSMSDAGEVTLAVTKADESTLTAGTFTDAFELKITNEYSNSVVFDGTATVTVPCDENVKYAYHIEDGKITERVSV